jgi:hypothetical protein
MSIGREPIVVLYRQLPLSQLRSRARTERNSGCHPQTATVNERMEVHMEQILINLVAGALGGVGAGKASPTFDLGMIGNIVSGVVGGGVLGQVVTLALPSIAAAAQAGDLSVQGIVSHVVAGGAGGAILTAIIGAIKNKATA